MANSFLTDDLLNMLSAFADSNDMGPRFPEHDVIDADFTVVSETVVTPDTEKSS